MQRVLPGMLRADAATSSTFVGRRSGRQPGSAMRVSCGRGPSRRSKERRRTEFGSADRAGAVSHRLSGFHPVPAALDAIAGRPARAQAIAQVAQPGDPVRAADAIIKVFEAPNPPLQLLLGKVALERIRENRKAHLRSIEEWEATTLSADFPSAN
jgi:hypothetical protein